MFEPRHEPPISRQRFINRLALHVCISVAILLFSLVIGMCGYEYFERLPWRDAFLNAAMLLGGMGPVNAPQTDAGKLFAGCYALYAGLVFIVMIGVMLTPVLHRLMHKFHWGQNDRGTE